MPVSSVGYAEYAALTTLGKIGGCYMFMFDYVIERKLPTGNWQKVTGTMNAKSADEVEKTLIRQNSNTEIRIVSIKKK